MSYEARRNYDYGNADDGDEADERRENVVCLVCPESNGERLEQVERRDDLQTKSLLLRIESITIVRVIINACKWLVSARSLGRD